MKDNVSEGQQINTDVSDGFECGSFVDTSLGFSSDPEHFLGVHMAPECTSEILMIGAWQPGKQVKFDFPAGDDSRSFCLAWYTNGKYEREWLVYSPLKNKMYSFACWLFPCRELQSFRSNWANPELGINKWKKGLEKIVKHEGRGGREVNVGNFI